MLQPSSLKALILDDELNIRRTLALCLEAEGHEVIAVGNGVDAQTEMKRTRFDICFLDMRLGVTSGLDLIPPFLEAMPWLKIIVITAHASIDNAVEAMKRGAFDYLEKPFTNADIYKITRKVATITQLEDRVRTLEEELSSNQTEIELQSRSPLMKNAIEIARSAATADATVLITGENGTGKTVLAKAIHSWSARQKKPFATVSCPSLSAELLESELFGHVKGAFTGAVKHHPGRIAMCEGGTLFLDEIGDMPIALQAKLLRFLQEREYEQVGDTTTRRADVRVIAATNVKLKDAVKAGRFREDLYYRLNVLEIAMPPLRDRLDDIELLAARFLAGLRQGKPVTGFTEKAIAKLKAYAWPGNIRELRNVIERAIILTHHEFIDTSDIALDDAHETSGADAPLPSLEEIETAHIKRVLAATRSMDQAAAVLGIDSVTLWRKRKRYGL